MVLRFPEASKKPRAALLRVSSVPQPCHKRATSVSQACHHSPSSVSQLTAGLLYGDGGMRGALRINDTQGKSMKTIKINDNQ